jgi:hypothetical protein
MSVGDKSHPPNFARVLRERIERPRRCAAEQRDELAPPQLIGLQGSLPDSVDL